MKCERGKGGWGGGGGGGKDGDEETVKEKGRGRWVNKTSEGMIHNRPAESEKVEQWERGRDVLSGLEKVSRGERRAKEEQETTGT